ncbi:hypothetical protein HanRHA438_Chr14g0642481 [Helianthus annuus]|nr:hypothetical protein HanRHA438_Chr14g0642481 [Helianthus annuus]
MELESVNSVRKLLANSRESAAIFKFQWNSWLPLRVNVFEWQASLDRIPKRDRFSLIQTRAFSAVYPYRKRGSLVCGLQIYV